MRKIVVTSALVPPTPKTATNNSIATSSADVFLMRFEALARFVADLYSQTDAAKYGLSFETFSRIVATSTCRYLPPDATDEQVHDFVSRLHVQELVLAHACASGNDAAWEAFLLRYREPLYQIGTAIARDEAVGRELSDSLYAELCGAGSHRHSPFFSYTGYGSLEGWLRTIMARSFIDRYRNQQRLVSLEAEVDGGLELAAPSVEPATPVDVRLEQATDDALNRLDSEDRFILASFFLHGRTLADIAGVLRVHESTVSRRVQKTLANLRKQILHGMVLRGMSRRLAEEAFAADVRDVRVNVGLRLQEKLQEATNSSSSIQTHGKQEGS